MEEVDGGRWENGARAHDVLYGGETREVEDSLFGNGDGDGGEDTEGIGLNTSGEVEEGGKRVKPLQHGVEADVSTH